MSTQESKQAQLQLLQTHKAQVEEQIRLRFHSARTKGSDHKPSVRFLSRDLRRIKAKIAALTVLALSFLLSYTACDATAPLPGCEEHVLESPSRECTYDLPAGIPCSEVKVYVDDQLLPEDGYTLVCSSGSLVISGSGCSAHRVTATWCGGDR